MSDHLTPVRYYRGERLEALTREQLVDAAGELGAMYAREVRCNMGGTDNGKADPFLVVVVTIIVFAVALGAVWTIFLRTV